MRPRLQFLEETLIERILGEAIDLLEDVGLEVQNENAVRVLTDGGATIDAAGRVRIPERAVLEAVARAPRGFALFDVLGEQTHDLSGDRVHFTPGSSGITVLDGETGEMRAPVTGDLVRFTKLTSGLPHIDAQSTAFICTDVPAPVQDSYRLFLCLLYGEKPVVTGAFTIESYGLMREMQLAVRGWS
jgi:trimethylamine--corrinoid protein Co-methyltransferase